MTSNDTIMISSAINGTLNSNLSFLAYDDYEVNTSILPVCPNTTFNDTNDPQILMVSINTTFMNKNDPQIPLVSFNTSIK